MNKGISEENLSNNFSSKDHLATNRTQEDITSLRISHEYKDTKIASRNEPKINTNSSNTVSVPKGTIGPT
jgi:hypothetical protein